MRDQPQLAKLTIRWLALVFCAASVLGPALPAPAQLPNAPSAANSASEPQKDTTAAASVADSPSSDNPEAMFPHLKDTRFWLSGQANFIFQTHPPFPADYSGP